MMFRTGKLPGPGSQFRGNSIAPAGGRKQEADIRTNFVRVLPDNGAMGSFSEMMRPGFRGVLVSLGADSDARSAEAIARAKANGLTVMVEFAHDAFALDDPLVGAHPHAFSIRRDPGPGPIDPRRPARARGVATARLNGENVPKPVIDAIVDRLEHLAAQGVDGVVLKHVDHMAPDVLGILVGALRQMHPGFEIGIDTEGRAEMVARCLAAVREKLDWALVPAGARTESVALARALEAVRPYAEPVIALAAGADATMIAWASTLTAGLVVTDSGHELDADVVARVETLQRESKGFEGAVRALSVGAPGVGVIARFDDRDPREATATLVVLGNFNAWPCPAPAREAVTGTIGAGLTAFSRREGLGEPFAPLAPHEVRVLMAKCAAPIAHADYGGAESARQAALGARICLEDIGPCVDDGLYPVKRVVGEAVTVSADIFADGHDVLGARLKWRSEDESVWQAAPLVHDVNDRWEGVFVPERVGRHEFYVEAWWDRFGTLRRDIGKKRDAGVIVDVDCAEGRALVADALNRASVAQRAALERSLGAYDAAIDPDAKAAVLLDDALASVMEALDPMPHRETSAKYPLDAERLAARFSSWYELFPRSQTESAERHGTFRDVIERLPAIRAMGFDTLYFPPIHPIGRAHRKGKNNATTAGPDEPGSPYAIGSDAGGHDAVHPELGTLRDFEALVAAAKDYGLEVALDFAIQCSPDHPWLKDHPGWFDWRPDGTIKYAENPPKKYQDIVNVDFYAKNAVPDLWLTLRDIVAFWIARGVTVFRVDNPHTKPFPFWEWMIRDIRRVHPEAIFLAEAFTRPKVMYRLAKVGFSQSYTYFTWRNEKDTLTDYLEELTTEAPRDFFRPHFFVNTPDINPTFLHEAGPPGFKIRAALAATLSGLFGVYSGFELCEAAPVPGKEEYLDSEKYEIRPRDWNTPGNIVADITLLNTLRRDNPELQTHLGVTFFNAWNDNILYFAKRRPGADTMILVAVSLDPHHGQEADFEVPLWAFDLADHERLDVADLVGGHRFAWHGKNQHMRLEPDRPYAIWRVRPPEGGL